MRQPVEGSEFGAAESRDPDRPVIAAGGAERIREWIDWFGITRLLTSAVAVVVVCVGAYWLVRTPVPPTEVSLPVAAAGGSTTVPQATLVPPSTSLGAGDESAAIPPVDAVVVVHVAGAVEQPGVYRVAATSRVDDAIEAAGGANADADPAALNLAAPVIDGSRIYVPTVGEDIPADPVVQPPAGVDEAAPTGPVDVNRASAVELETLPGVGPATAAAIITERDVNGPFSSFEDLERVPGIGPAKLAALSGLVAT